MTSIPPSQLCSPARQHSLDEAAQVDAMRRLVHAQEQQITQELSYLLRMEQASGVGHGMQPMPQMPTLDLGPQPAPFMGFPQMDATWPPQSQQPMMVFAPQQMMPFPQQPHSPSYQPHVQYAPQHFGDPPPAAYQQPGYGWQPPLSPLSPQTQYSSPATHLPQGVPLPRHPPLPPPLPPEAGPRTALGFLPVEQQQQLSDQLYAVVLAEVGAELAQTVTLMLLDNDLPHVLKVLASEQDRSQGALRESPDQPNTVLPPI